MCVRFDSIHGEVDALANQVADGFLRRDPQVLSDVFDTHKDPLSNLLSHHKIQLALKAAHSRITDVDPLLLRTINATAAGAIDQGVFARVAVAPDDLERWLQNIPLAQILADAFPANCTQSGDILRGVVALTEARLENVLDAAVMGIRRAVRQSVTQLRTALDALDEKASEESLAVSSKFEINKMSCGTLQDFHDGLTKRIGECRSFCLSEYMHLQLS